MNSQNNLTFFLYFSSVRYQSRWHGIEAKRRLKSFRFLGRLGVWMMRVKKLRDKIIIVQKLVRGVLARKYGVHQALLQRLTRKGKIPKESVLWNLDFNFYSSSLPKLLLRHVISSILKNLF